MMRTSVRVSSTQTSARHHPNGRTHPLLETTVLPHRSVSLVFRQPERWRVVVQRGGGPAAEVGEGCLVTFEQVPEPLVLVGPHEDPPAESEHHHEQVDLDPLLSDPDADHSPVDLRLFPWPSLVPHRRYFRPRRLTLPFHVPPHP